MKNELLDTSSHDSEDLLIDTLNRSTTLALGVFDREQLTPQSYVHVMEQMHLSLKRPQESVFAALFEWRDAVARQEDESPHYVMPKRALLALSTNMPVTMDQLTV